MNPFISREIIYPLQEKLLHRPTFPYLAELEKRFKDKGIIARAEVLTGKAADEIVNFAGKNPFSLIVMATHGRSGLSRLVYGSVAVSLLHGATCPIFLVKPQ